MIEKIFIQKNLRTNEPILTDTYGSGVPPYASFELNEWIKKGFSEGDFGISLGGTSNLSLGTPTSLTYPILNSNGTGFSMPLATRFLAGLMGAADKQQLYNLSFLTGVSIGDTNLGSFEGTTIPDNLNIKEALQALEHAIPVLPENENIIWQSEGVNTGIVPVSTVNFIGTGVKAQQSDNTLNVIITSRAINTSFDSTSTLISENVQDAIEELDDLKANDDSVVHKSGEETIDGVKIFTAQPQGIESGSIIVTPQGSITVTNAQAAIYQLDELKANDSVVVHKSGAETITGVKTFSAQPVGIRAVSVDYTPSSTITSTTVQGAIQELDTKKQNLLQVLNENALLAPPGQYVRLNFKGPGVLASQNVSNANQVDITIGATGLAEIVDSFKYYELYPSDTNVIPSLMHIPVDYLKVVICVNGNEEFSGITVNNLGFFSVDNEILGYDLEVTDSITVKFFS